MDKVRVNYDKAVELSQKAVSFAESLPRIGVPDIIVPDAMELEGNNHALFLFYACSLDSMRRADLVYRAMRNLSKEVSPKDFSTLSETSWKKLLTKHFEKPSKMGDTVNSVMKNSMRMWESYQNNPRKIL